MEHKEFKFTLVENRQELPSLTKLSREGWLIVNKPKILGLTVYKAVFSRKKK